MALSPETAAAWAKAGLSPADDDQIAEISRLWGGPLPDTYARFLATYGFAHWGDALPSSFGCEIGEADIHQMFDPVSVGNCVDLVPDGYLAVAGDYSGHGFILLAKADGSVWFEEDGDLCRIADDFDAFLGVLYAPEEPDPRAPWYGNPEKDKRSRFFIAPQTRAAWATYGTGDEPEDEAELTAVEAALGRPLPEALGTFLRRFGHVVFFGDAIASFACPGGGEDQVSVIYAAPVLLRALPLQPGAPLPFASTARAGGELLIGLAPEDEGHIYWRCDEVPEMARIADDLRSFIGHLYTRDY